MPTKLEGHRKVGPDSTLATGYIQCSMAPMKYWIFLGVAILAEVFGTTSMKLSDGFTKLIPSIALVICYVVSFALLTLSLKKLDLSIAYAVWAGAGTALTAVIGFWYFKESPSVMKILCIGLIIAGVVGLKFADGATQQG